ncbi:MAG: hypothetical protein KGL39_49530 [Patescibacteria group bacterium]|nr:hypothetical protein [Patescibacteria group bacterium]
MKLETVQRWLKDAVGHRNKWRAEAKKAYDFVSGEQWSPEDRQVMEDQMRPVTVFNRIAPIVDAIVGHETANRQAVSYLPRQVGASMPAELISAAAKWVRDECGAEGEESDAFFDCVVTGEGWTDTRVDYDDDPDGKIITERVDPREMDADPSSQKKNYSDAKWICRTRKMQRHRAQDQWPDADLEPANRRDASEPIDVIAAAFYELDSGAQGRSGVEADLVLVHDFQWWEYEPIYRVPAAQMPPEMLQAISQAIPDAKPSETGLLTFTAEQWAAVSSILPIKPMEQRRKAYKRMFWSGMEVLEEKSTPTAKSFTFKAMTAKRDHEKRYWYGIVRGMRDPQLWSNKFMSLALEIIATGAKGGILAEIDAFQDPRQAEDDWADPAKIVYTKPGAIQAQKIMERPKSNPPSGMQELMMYANQSLNDTAGVNPAVMGFSQQLDTNGILEQTRQMAGLNLLAYLFDALRRYRKEQGALLMEMIRQYIPQGRLVKIEGPEGAQYVPLAFDPSVMKYDIVVDEAPTSPNVKQQTWETFVSMAPHLPPQMMSPQFILPLLKYSPFPAALVQEWTKEAAKPNPQAQMAQQLEAGEKQAKIGELQATAHLKQAQAAHIGQVDPTEIESKRLGLQTEALKANAEIEAAQAKTAQTHLDANKAILEHHLDTQKALRDAHLDAQRAQRELQGKV